MTPANNTLANNTVTKPKIDPNLDLVLERTIDVSPELVWEAWTTPEHMKHWFCPKPWYVSEAECDVRPGGKFRTVMNGPNGERHDNTGCYLEVIPHRKLAWTDALGPDYRPTGAPFMTAIILLEPHGSGGCKYTAIALHKDPDAKKSHEDMGFAQGWGTVLEQLVEFIKSR